MGAFSAAIIKELGDGSIEIHSAPARIVAWSIVFALFPLVIGFCWWRWPVVFRGIPIRIFAVIFMTLPLLAAPGVATEFIRLTPDNLSVETGFWFASLRIHIPLKGVDLITQRIVSKGALHKSDTYWDFHYQNGQVYSLSLPDLFADNRPVIIDYLRRYGINVTPPEARRPTGTANVFSYCRVGLCF